MQLKIKKIRVEPSGEVKTRNDEVDLHEEVMKRIYRVQISKEPKKMED